MGDYIKKNQTLMEHIKKHVHDDLCFKSMIFVNGYAKKCEVDPLLTYFTEEII